MVLANDWASREATLRSYELIARYVMPELRGQLAPLRASYDMVGGEQALLRRPGDGRHPPGLRRRRRADARRTSIPAACADAIAAPSPIHSPFCCARRNRTDCECVAPTAPAVATAG